MDFGKHQSHKEYFISNRNFCLHQISCQTNNLIIRLDKLINQSCNSDITKKDFEKSIVPWSDNSDFSNCRICNIKFSITKRKHHCRLCGKIMCRNCSEFLSYTSARKLTGPDVGAEFLTNNKSDLFVGGPGNANEKRSISLIPSDSLHFVKNKTEQILGSLIRAREDSQELPFRNGADETDSLRICEMCKKLLARREAAMDLRMSQSIFVDIYQKLSQLLTKMDNLLRSYKHMAESLSCGESIYTLEAANELRKKLISSQREITLLSERIESWGMQTEAKDPLFTNKPHNREIMLQKNIKIFAINLVHEAMSLMPELPSAEAYQKLTRSKIMLNSLNYTSNKRSMSPSAMNSFSRSNVETRSLRPSCSLATLKSASQDNGWVSSSPFQIRQAAKSQINDDNVNQTCKMKQDDGYQVVNVQNVKDSNEELNVIQQQYLNIKSYLQQAAHAGRLEEVEILEKSLFDLETELKRMQLSTPDLST